MLQIRISRDENLEPLLLSHVKQFAVRESRPATFVGSRDLMLPQAMAQWYRCALIEQDSHSGRNKRAARGMLQHAAHLLKGHAWEPFDERRY